MAVRPLTARPTTYKGVRMRSRTEARYAAFLDVAGLVWEYEPQCFADADGQYLPDFRVTDRGVVVYVEVKGAMPDDLEDIQRRMEIIWSSEPGAPLMIVVTSTGDSFHAHPDVPDEWVHHWPRRSMLDPEEPAAEAKPPPAPTAQDRANLAAIRQARTVLSHTMGDHETCGPDCIPIADTHAAGDHRFCAPGCTPTAASPLRDEPPDPPTAA